MLPQGEVEHRWVTYLRRLLVSIVARTEQVRTSSIGEGLWSIYNVSNGGREWLVKPKAVQPWERIATSRDLPVTVEKKCTSQTLDTPTGEWMQGPIGLK